MKILKLIKVLIITITLTLSLGSSVVSADGFNNFAATSASKKDACVALNQLDPNRSCTTGSQTVNNIASQVVSILSIIVGIASVIMIIFSGFRFITAAGDTNSINSARSTLIYAVVGIIIAVLAQFIAQKVLTTATNIQSSSSNTLTSKIFPEDG